MHKDAVCACVGAGLLLAWLFGLLCFEGLIRHDPSIPDINRHDPFFLATAFSVAACGALTWSVPSCLRLAVHAVGSRVAVGVASAVLGAVTLAMGLVEPAHVWICAVCGVAAGAAFFVVVLGWFVRFSACDVKTVGYLFFAMILVTFVALWALFTVRTYGSRLAMIALALVFLAVSCALYMATQRSGLIALGLESLEVPEGDGARRINAVLIKTAVFAFASSFAGMFVWVYDIKVYEDIFLTTIIRSGMTPWTYAASGAVVAATFLFLWLSSRRSGFAMVTFHRILFLVLLLSISLALGGSAWFFGTYTMSHLAFFLSQMGVWVVLLRAAYLFDCSPLRHIALILAAQYLGDGVAFALFLGVPLEFWASGAGHLALVGLLGAVACVFLFVFTEADVKVVDRVAVASPRDAFKEACERLCVRYGLTKREAEVLGLLARGKNAVAIQEELSVSYSTIKTHKQSIYGKLGVHSQQELLLLVEGAAGRG